MRPLIGISCCVKGFGIFNTPNHAASDSYVRVIMGPVGGLPVLLPAAGPEMVAEILSRVDGLIMTGSRSNVWPGHYDGPAHAEGTPEDHQRDATTLPLIRAAIEHGVPLLAICRGMQELNVALGGSLDQRIQDLPGRMDHSTPSDQHIPLVRTGKAHAVRLAPGSLLAKLAGAENIPVNSLHNQGVQKLAPRLEAEGWAPDGTVEAVRVKNARGYAMGVQWHPEYDWERDSLSRSLFEVFGDVCRQWAEGRRDGRLRQAAE
ncbi:MAG: gamma-glutamyl-gamma-aminobutyrate hydrolase family protein [Alphaproteobacteria bacterium]|jgi:putative glutamine amidotransferase|nr:gamma-glutamyl-gamma-aminobutyrate hydrolase family protein [Alphaproteobacteria bacterium]